MAQLSLNKDYITVYDGVIEPRLCDNLIKFFEKNSTKEADIEKIFLRDDEKKSSDPNINISIKINDKEEIIKRKSNIHRARLAKFKKSMLNGEMLFIDEEKKIYKFIDGNKIYIK